jgi:hypothetical protein
VLFHRCQKLKVSDGGLALVGIEQHGKIVIVAREILRAAESAGRLAAACKAVAFPRRRAVPTAP